VAAIALIYLIDLFARALKRAKGLACAIGNTFAGNPAWVEKRS
jgi:hypothetical protein